jgi:hypothetical protein
MVDAVDRDFSKIREVLAPEQINQAVARKLAAVRARAEEIAAVAARAPDDRDARDVLGCLPELRETQDALFALCGEVCDARKNDGFVESNLFRLAVDVLFEDEIHRLQARETENRKQLQKWLGEVREHIARDEIADWCGRLTAAAEELERAVEEGGAGDEVSDAELEELERELADVNRQADELAAESARAVVERAKTEQEWFEQAQMNTKYAKWVGGSSGVREREVELFSARYLCAVCGERMCGCVLKKCAHPMCRECADVAQTGGNCPICKTPYKDGDQIRFFYKP